MRITYKVGNITEAPQGNYLATFIPASFEIDGESVDRINKAFNSKEKLETHFPEYCFLGGDCLTEDNVLFIVSRANSEDRSSDNNLHSALLEMYNIVKENKITKIAIARDSTDSDVLSWYEIEHALKTIFDDTEVTFTVYVENSSYLEEDYETPIEEEDNLGEDFYERLSNTCNKYKDSIMKNLMDDINLLADIINEFTNK